MKHFILFILCLTTATAVAQPPARRNAEAQAAAQSKTTTTQGSAYRDFPTAPSMPDDAAWRRDIYLSLDLTKDANAVLYYPTTPTDGRENLFTYLFKLLLRGELKAYDYKLDGNEDFSESNRVKVTDLMDRYHIFYETKGEKVRVSDSDIPSEEVKLYYIKVSRYYDQHTSQFRTSVSAICPVLKRGDDDFGGTDAQYPMFWVKYSDIAPRLSKLQLMSSNLNNAAMMSADDFFMSASYEGDIYKTTNLQDRILANYCETDSALVKEQKRINKEMNDFQDRVWGRDSVAMAKAAAEKALADSIAATEKSSKRSARRTTTSRRSSASVSSSSSSSSSKESSSSSSRSSRSATISVRRQRH
ncbi:MAG: gliding motility protein GldN [Bacteroidales bacterium]|nr:gliding motility protein GldN [Bacteroidales bacterium]